MREEWKCIEGAIGIEISNKGNIRYADGKLKKTDKDSEGYLRTSIRINGKQERARIHRLVAKAFIPNPYKKPFVNHKNGNKADNRVNNLEWCTERENALLAYMNGQYCINKRYEAIIAIELATGQTAFFRSQSDAAKYIGISDSEVNKVLKGKRNSSHGYKFYYHSDYVREI